MPAPRLCPRSLHLVVSRRFGAQTETALARLLAADLSSLDLVAIMVDGEHLGEHACIVP
jgi:putative transposase